jgi:hypothetical protein
MARNARSRSWLKMPENLPGWKRADLYLTEPQAGDVYRIPTQAITQIVIEQTAFIITNKNTVTTMV